MKTTPTPTWALGASLVLFFSFKYLTTIVAGYILSVAQRLELVKVSLLTDFVGYNTAANIIAVMLTLLCLVLAIKFARPGVWSSSLMSFSQVCMLLGHFGIIGGILFLFTMVTGAASGILLLPVIYWSGFFYLVGTIFGFLSIFLHTIKRSA